MTDFKIDFSTCSLGASVFLSAADVVTSNRENEPIEPTRYQLAYSGQIRGVGGYITLDDEVEDFD
jgi:hypothetical protein